MPNKKIKKRRLKNLTKKTLAAFLASALGLSSGAALTFLNKTYRTSASAGLSYFNDSDYLNQTRIMMDGNNCLKNGFWMNAAMTALSTTPETYSAVLKFTIPGYDPSNLKIFIMDKNPLNGYGIKEYQLSSSYFDPVPSIYLDKLKQSSYNVHVYNGSLSEENFIAKAEFSVTNDSEFTGEASTVNLLDSAGAPIKLSDTQQKLTYFSPTASTGANQFKLSLPYGLIPYDCATVKVVFFATDRNGEGINIDQTIYDYAWFDSAANDGSLIYYPEANWGIDDTTRYEAHFYKDEVQSGNFICKAVGIIAQ